MKLKNKIYIGSLAFLLNFTYLSLLFAAAPDDINTNQRTWYDAVDVNANDNYTDNPANGSSIGIWYDKSGLGQNISSTRYYWNDGY